MTYRLFFVALSIAGVIPAMPGALFAQRTGPEGRVILENYTLKQCIEYALTASPDVANARLDVEMAKAQVGQVRADGLPQVNASVAISGNYKPTVGFFPARLAGDPNAPEDLFIAVPFQPPYSGQAAISGSQMLFDGSWFLGLKAASIYAELSQKSLTRTRIDVAAAVSKAYYGVLVAEDRITLLDNTFNRLESLLKETRALYENGLVEKIDVDRIEVSFNNIGNDKRQLQRILMLNKAILKFQMGMQQSDEISIGEKIQDFANRQAPSSEGESFAYNQRVEYSILETQRSLDVLNIKNTRIGYLPKLSLISGNGALAGPPNLTELMHFGKNWQIFGSIGIQLNIPIFDGLRKHYMTQKNKIELIKTENNMRNLVRSIDLEITQASTSLQNSLDNLEAQKRNVELAREIVRVSKIKYQEGVGSNLEVIDAENSFKQAETNYYNALYEALIAQVDLAKAKGTLLE